MLFNYIQICMLNFGRVFIGFKWKKEETNVKLYQSAIETPE